MFARSGDAKLYWESAGRGEAVLLVMGLGMAATMWFRTVPVLAQGLRVISFDNRGVGRSDCPRGPYTLRQMAEDALAVMDAAKLRSASVYGISLGGMIAQELALNHPERVRALVLGATTPGGPRHQLPDPEVLSFLRRRVDMPPEEGMWASVPYLYGQATREKRAELIAEDISWRLLHPSRQDGYRAQLDAARWHDTGDRLRSLQTPTLVLHGSEDRMVRLVNGQLLASSIPGARLEVLEGAGHLYLTDAPQAARTVLRFLTG